MQGNLIVRLLAVAVVAAAIAYIIHLRNEVAQSPAAVPAPVAQKPAEPAAQAPAQPAAAAPAAALSSRTIDPEKRAAMIKALGGPNSSLANPVWFMTIPNNSEAAAFQKQLQGIFEEAGWIVKANTPVRFPMRAGIYIFAADEDPPNYVDTAQQALEAGGISIVSSGRGYREFYNERKRDNPNWVGFDMTPDQTYVIVIGRKPAEEP